MFLCECVNKSLIFSGGNDVVWSNIPNLSVLNLTLVYFTSASVLARQLIWLNNVYEI